MFNKNIWIKLSFKFTKWIFKYPLKKACIKLYRLSKRIWTDKFYISPIISTKEKYLISSLCIISWSYLFINKSDIKAYLFVPVLYLFIRAWIKESKEDVISKKYKGISEIFNGKVKVIEIKDNIFKLHSFIPYDEVCKKESSIEHFLNREIESIKRDNKNFRLIYVYTKKKIEVIKKKIGKYNEFYMLHDYIKSIDVNKKYNLPAMFGVDIHGKNIILDMMDMYHTFISGETSGGKSTLLNTIIQSIQYFCNNVMFIMVDFKLVGLGIYRNFNNCVFVKNNDDFREKIIWLENEMMKRYEIFLKAGVMDILEYHKKGKKMNYIVLVIDEISNIKLAGKNKNSDIDIEDKIANLLNMARASGIILIACTQNPYGVELKTNIRNKFITNISGRIKRHEVQKMTGVLGTEKLQRGEFKMNSTNISELEFKSYFQNTSTYNNVFEELKKMYEFGGVKLEKNIIDFEEFKNKS